MAETYFVVDFDEAFATNYLCYGFSPPIGASVVISYSFFCS